MRRPIILFAALALGGAALNSPAVASAQPLRGGSETRAAAHEGEWTLNPAGTWETEAGCNWAGSTGYLGGAWKEFRCEYIGAFGWRMWIRRT
ncbi:hypothetical protein ACRYCC_11015 [Actinomadura scrupuli]|uniref:hypothetical protein n=1 Tax=Actinomadura scrupuli TaxID=559629 RepID=UPI003D9773C7